MTSNYRLTARHRGCHTLPIKEKRPVTSLRKRIRQAYRQHPHADSQEIVKIIGCKDTRYFRETLVAVQQHLRGFTAGRRQNHHAHPHRLA